MTEPPEGWGAPGPDDPEPNANPYGQWGGFSPPPGWSPPPRQGINKGELFAGIAACILLNVLLFFTAAPGTFGQATGLLALGLNIAAIAIPAANGHKGFAVGFALGYVVLFVLALGACFLLLSSID